MTTRWARQNAELPLLALLPGLNRHGDGKRVLLHTAIRGPAIRVGLLLLAGWLDALFVHAGWSVPLASLAFALVCLGYFYAMVLGILGGCPLVGLGKTVLIIGICILLSLTALLPMLWEGGATPLTAAAPDMLGVAWLALVLLLMWLGRLGWRGLQQRPHPFLANDS